MVCNRIYPPKLLVHVWDINIYVKLDKTIRKRIHKLIIKRYNSFNNFQTYIKINRKILSAICGGSFSNISNISRIINFLGLNKGYFEKHIELFRDSKTGAYNRTYKSIFPIKINPIIIRILLHLIGDGSVYKDRIYYGQKIGVKFMNSLVFSLIEPIGYPSINNYCKKRTDFYYINIPMVFAKAVISCFKMRLKDLKTHIFLEKLLYLPREYRIQALAALYVDEGCVQSNCIRMSEKKVVETIAKIIDSLGYKRSKLTYKLWTGMCFGKYHEVDMYQVSLWNEGILNFYDDIQRCVNKYNNKSLGLWHKDVVFKEKVKSVDTLTIKYRKEAIYLKNRIINILEERKTVVLGELSRELKIDADRTYYLLKSLRTINKVKKLRLGEYALVF